MKNELIVLLLTLSVGYMIYEVSKTEPVMDKTKKKKKEKDVKRELKRDPETGLLIFSGLPSQRKILRAIFPKTQTETLLLFVDQLGYEHFI